MAKVARSPAVRAVRHLVVDDDDAYRFAADLVSYGGLGDSFYEYLLKQWIQGRGSKHHPGAQAAVAAAGGGGGGSTSSSAGPNERYRRYYDEAVAAMKEHMVAQAGNMTVLSEWKAGSMNGAMDHLACFVPGMLTLGAMGKTIAQDIALAQQLIETCVQLYFDQPTGIGPERVQFELDTIDGTKGGRAIVADELSHNDAGAAAAAGDTSSKPYKIASPKYLLRPETIESLFYLWRKTHNERYREWGWQILLAIEEHCKTQRAYSGSCRRFLQR